MFSVRFLNQLRRAELASVIEFFPPRSRVLDLGAGTGEQAKALASRGFDVSAIDLSGGTYANDQVFPVEAYDGVRIPRESGTFDVVYTSNVLEHIAASDLPQMHAEIRRVLRPGGRALHVMPSHTWRAWTTMTSVPDGIVQGLAMLAASPREWPQRTRAIGATVLPRRHGERGTVVSEFWLYHPRTWRRHLEANGMDVSNIRPIGYFYTGNMLFGQVLPLARRNALAKRLGSSAYVYVCRPRPASGTSVASSQPR